MMLTGTNMHEWINGLLYKDTDSVNDRLATIILNVYNFKLQSDGSEGYTIVTPVVLKCS